MADFVKCQIRVPAENLKKLKVIAKAYNCSVNALIVKLIDEDLKKEKL